MIHWNCEHWPAKLWQMFTKHCLVRESNLIEITMHIHPYTILAGNQQKVLWLMASYFNGIQTILTCNFSLCSLTLLCYHIYAVQQKSILPLGQWIRSQRTSTSAFVTRRKQWDTLDNETLNLSEISLELSWLANAHSPMAICFWGSIRGLPNEFSFGKCSLGASNWQSISNVEGDRRKWLLKTSPWYRGTVSSK